MALAEVKTVNNKAVLYIVGGLLFLVVAYLIFSSGFWKPQPEVLSSRASEYLFTDSKGEPDWGYRVYATIKNEGATGYIIARGYFEIDGQSFSKENRYSVDADELINIGIDFPEVFGLSLLSDGGYRYQVTAYAE